MQNMFTRETINMRRQTSMKHLKLQGVGFIHQICLYWNLLKCTVVSCHPLSNGKE